MDTSISGLSKAQTKSDFINRAHEARQARELARRQDVAATTIQAYFKSTITRRRLKRDAHDQLNQMAELNSLPNSNNLLTIIRKLLFLCHPSRDRQLYDTLLKLLANAYSDNEFAPQDSSNDCTKEMLLHDKVELPDKHLENNNICLNSDCSKDFLQTVAEGIVEDEQALTPWCNTIDKILKICFTYLECIDFNKHDSIETNLQYMDTYLGLINLFTSRLSSKSIDTTESGTKKIEIVNKISETLNTRSLQQSRHVFKSLNIFIAKIINRPLSDIKSSVLTKYLKFTLWLLEPARAILKSQDEENFSSFGQHGDSIEILTDLLCLPTLMINLEKFSPSCLKELNDNSTFELCLKLLTTNDQNLQRLTSTPALCLLANVIHLASINESVVKTELISYVILITKILRTCQRNMKMNSRGDVKNLKDQKNKKKLYDSTDESYNHILGWLAREQAPTIDRDTSKLIKCQLDHLWSSKSLKLLFDEIIKHNERHLASLKQDANNNSRPGSNSKFKTNVFAQLPKHQNSSDTHTTSFTSISSLRRVVERAALTMTKTINSGYAKTTAPFGSSGSAKLMTEEATRISLVCYMLYMALETLRIIKQDILTALCLHDYVLRNLWTFISSLGPSNGLKAFLDHLAIHTKTNAPEFHILTLFCECSSHLISILDDSELYDQQKPFTLEDLISISSFLNSFVFRIVCNQLVSSNLQEMDPILQATHKLLTDLYKRDCRRKFAPQDHWLIKDIKMSIFLKDLEAGKPVAKTILSLLPHIIPHKERVLIFRRLIAKDKAQYCSGFSTYITIHRSRIVEDGYQQLARLPPNALKGLIRVKFINDHGLDEAGIDLDGVFKEFLEDTIKRVFDPALNLFCSTSEQRLYPSPTSRLHEDHLSLFNFVGKMLGKAIYEGIVVDVPFASFFLSRVLGLPQSPLYSPIDELPSMDPELYKSLTYIKHYEGDVSELDLTFSIDQDFMGKIETYELEPGGKFVPVTRESRVRYIHSVANFRMKTQIEQQTEAFVRGFKSIIDLEWLNMFSTAEFQRLISGDESPIDLLDLRRHTKYFGGFHNSHRVICWLWDILEKDFSAEEHRLFLKFVTSCSKPPLLGFVNLEPPFTIRCVEVSDDQDLGDSIGSVLRGFLAIRRSDPVDRLPTSSTCFNMLKLPNYQRRSTLREKLRYAICNNPGFELS